MRRRLLPLLATCLLAGCGGNGEGSEPVEQVRPEVRDEVRAAQSPQASDFPSAAGKTLQEVADEVGGAGPEMGLAASVFTVGENRLPFGVIDEQGRFLYGPTAVYVARGPDGRAQGPLLAPADVLVTEPAFRSEQAASEGDPFAAVYAARAGFDKPGQYAVLAVTKTESGLVSAGTEVEVVRASADDVPDVGERPPKVKTDTLDSVAGDEELLDTRRPPSDMHARSFDEVLGTKPVALLFATPQLCQSRVCGPVVDVALQLKQNYGDRVEFIHQEVYKDNDLEKGLRDPLIAFNLKSEPWLFVVDGDGRITARLEGSFGLNAFEQAIKTAL